MPSIKMTPSAAGLKTNKFENLVEREMKNAKSNPKIE